MSGDRADVTPLHGRSWDAAIDTSGYDPRARRRVGGARRRPLRLRLHLQRLSRLARQAGRRGLARVAGRRGLRPGQGRRRAAASCRTARSCAPGLIVGPHDNVFRLPWWVRRIMEGGVVPAPGDPDRPLQIIDARDLASFLLDLAEKRIAGAFNGTGADRPDDDARAARGRPATPSCAGSPTTSSRRPRSSRGSSSRCGFPARYRGHLARRHRARRRRRACAAARSPRPSPTSAPGSKPAARRELDDWRAEHRPPRMSAEREDALIRLLC